MSRRVGLKSLTLVNYKGFENHVVTLRHTNILVGANNAGKSTALGALRVLAAMVPQARRVNPSETGEVAGRIVRGWSITNAALDASAFSGENIRHDFRADETRIEATTLSGVRLVASWADMSDLGADEPAPAGRYFVFPPDGGKITNPRSAARDLVPNIGVVPSLTPLDDRESYISDETLRRNVTSKRSSRYFRNALYRLDPTEWIDFTSFVYERTPELASLDLYRAQATVEDDFDLFYVEEGTRREREIGWAGDGIQIWLQALYHLWRQRETPVVLLDEPDVFLHPDLQRRLARTLFAADQQVVLATHSVEMLAEAEPGSAVWIDRSRRRAERPKGDGSLALMGRRLGSGYELGVGRALRSSVALFVEGDDAPVIAHLARQLGSKPVASADGYATIPLGGFSRNSVAGAFAETMDALGADVRTYIILDGDLRAEEIRIGETERLETAGARTHIWQRRELENYLLVPEAIAKISGVELQEVRSILQSVIAGLSDEARRAVQSTRIEERGHKMSTTGGLAPKTVLEKADEEFEKLWSSEDGRLVVVDAKLAIRALNRTLQLRKVRTVNVHSLAKSIPSDRIHPEVRDVVESLETLIKARQ